MNEDQVKIFLAVAEAGSFSKAEENMHISKQAMLRQVNHLEEELGFPLLIRSRSGITLTQAGSIFRKGMMKMNREMESLLVRCRQVNTPSGPPVIRVGNVEHQALLTPVTQAFTARYPQIRVTQVIHPNHSGEWRVEHGVQDVAETFRLAYTKSPKAFAYRPLTEVPYVAAMRKGHPLAKKKKVSFEDLSKWQLMWFPIMLEEAYAARIRDAFSASPENLISRKDVDNQVPAAYECIDSDKLLLTANPFIEGISELQKIPLACGWTREYGIIYQEPASPAVQQYVDTALEVYGNT